MKILSTFIILIFCSLSLYAQTNSTHVKVDGYYKGNGTYVQPYFRTAPNSTNRDNFSTKGNINPYTNEVGRFNADNNTVPSANVDLNNCNLDELFRRINTYNPCKYNERPLYMVMKKVSVREHMDYSSAVVMELDVNVEVRIINSFFGDNGWWEVYYDGKSGYISPNYLKKSDNDERLTLKMYINTLSYIDLMTNPYDSYSECPSYIVIKKANVREHMSTATAIITTLNAGDEVKVINSFFGNMGWWEIYHNGVTGYMSTSLLQRKKSKSQATLFTFK